MMIIKSDNILLEGKHGKPVVVDYRYIPSDEKMPLLLYVHGFKGFKDWGYFNIMADYYTEKGFVVVKMNFSHNGTTPTNPTEFVDLEAFGNNNFTKELDDISTVLDLICSSEFEIFNHIDYTNLFIKGHSRGGGTCVIKASEDARINGLITYAAINDFKFNYDDASIAYWEEKKVIYVPNARTNQNMPMYYQMAENVFENEERLDIERASKIIDKPWLIIHGTSDETLPVSMAETFKTWNPKAELFIIEDADHTFGGSHPYDNKKLPKHAQMAIDRIAAFIKELKK